VPQKGRGMVQFPEVNLVVDTKGKRAEGPGLSLYAGGGDQKGGRGSLGKGSDRVRD